MTYDEFKNVLDLPNINSTEYIAIVVKDFNGNKQEFADFFFENSSNSTKTFIKLNSGSVYMILNQDVVLNEHIIYESVTDLPELVVPQESDS